MVSRPPRALRASFLAAWLLACAASLPPGAAPRTPAEPAPPEPSVRLLEGPAAVAWGSLLQPTDTTLVVFATLWCPVCQAERPAVEASARAHRGARQTLYVFSGGEPEEAASRIRALRLAGALTVVVDADGALADRYGISATPTLLLLDRRGEVRGRYRRIRDVPPPGERELHASP